MIKFIASLVAILLALEVLAWSISGLIYLVIASIVLEFFIPHPGFFALQRGFGVLFLFLSLYVIIKNDGSLFDENWEVKK